MLLAVDIHFGTIDKSIVEARLRAVPQTNEARELALRKSFEEVGCSGAKLNDQVVNHVKAPNLICELAGDLDSTIIVGAHSDLIDRGHGIVDNWSGCAMLPTLYQSLKSFPRRHRIVFIAFTAEEKGMVGSAFYVKQMSKSDLQKTSAMVNLDSLGLSSTKVELTRADKGLTAALAGVARSMNVPLHAVDVHQVGRSDSDSFQDKKVPTVNIHSVTTETWPVLHSARDRLDAIHSGRVLR